MTPLEKLRTAIGAALRRLGEASDDCDQRIDELTDQVDYLQIQVSAIEARLVDLE